MKFLYAAAFLLSSLLILPSGRAEDILKLSSDVERELSGRGTGKNKSGVIINQSTRIKYPQSRGVYGHGHSFESKNGSRKLDRNPSYIKNENSGINETGNIEIRQSDKIQYPRDTTNIGKEKSERNTWYNIKIYPNYTNDKFERIKAINAINREMKTQVNKNFALIGPISEGNLGMITKTLVTKGYSELEYIKIK
ncbi:hypothetical protein [Borrelia sp. P9F1]|uniref:hypothetical protein n=1 Tax=Borrelia sp. P9F1 TaxID=3058374 RepID=UPI00264950F3|nr:hypothetical protein [Borrelia sp. P9F1]WKC57687.1 hypothetical protein QYZ68_00515 [Borrelia sp. P9F1]